MCALYCTTTCRVFNDRVYKYIHIHTAVKIKVAKRFYKALATPRKF